MDHSGMQMAKSSGKRAKRGSAHSNARTKSKPAAGKGEDHEMGSMPMEGESGMEADVTRPQLVTITLFTLLMLAAGMTLPAANMSKVNSVIVTNCGRVTSASMPDSP